MKQDWLYAIDEVGETLLSRLSKTSRMDLASILFRQEIDDALRNTLHLPPLHRAAYWGYDDAVRDLLAQGADPNERDESGETPLHKAARLGNIAAARTLVENGADINMPNNLGMTPLHWAVVTADIEIAEFLIEQGANTHAREWVMGGLTPMELARLLRLKEMVGMLELHATLF